MEGPSLASRYVGLSLRVYIYGGGMVVAATGALKRYLFKTHLGELCVAIGWTG